MSGSHCPICGVRWADGHRCSDAKLRAIDAANTRAADAELFGTAEPFHRRSEGWRIDEGFQILGMGEDGDDEDQ